MKMPLFPLDGVPCCSEDTECQMPGVGENNKPCDGRHHRVVNEDEYHGA